MTPRQVRTCVLLSKKARREYDIPADYIGFEIPDEFVVGYGLDYAEKYRNLPQHRCAETGVVLLKVFGEILVLFPRPHRLRRNGTRTSHRAPHSAETHAAVLDEFPKLAGSKNSTLKAVGLEYEDDDFVLSDGDEVSFFPPVQGG